jgi:hypothetical protein
MRLIAVLPIFLLACGAPFEPSVEAFVNDDETTESTETELNDVATGPSTYTYFSVRRDYRRCIAPLCGGFWVKRVGRDTTRCADGKWRNECYVFDMDMSALDLSEQDISNYNQALAEERGVVRASLLSQTIMGFAKIGRLEVSEAFSAASSAAATGVFYRVRDNGIRCISSPCFSLEAAKLNSPSKRNLSSLGLDALAVDDETLAAAWDAIADDYVIVAGFTHQVKAAAKKKGIELRASQVYLRVKPSKTNPNYCDTDTDCALSTYTTPVNAAADCYCPMCPAPMSASSAEANAAGFLMWCAATHGSCPLPMCAAPPPVGCVEHRCAYVAEFR